MKVGYYCESPADQAAMAVFTEGLLGRPPEPISLDLEGRSVPAFFGSLGGVFRGVHYQSDAEGLVIVVDCDDTDLHDPGHDAAVTGRCRFCQVSAIIDHARRQLKPVPGRSPIKVAIGLAVPAIEAWYLVGKEHAVGEAAWKAAGGRPPFTRQRLKELVYGTDKPSLERATECAVREARRIFANLAAIETAFPVGFGLMAEAIRSWKI
jgi:hypothetical protein